MHAYLLISQNSKPDTHIEKLAGDLQAKIMEFPLLKIEDVRNLNNLIRLSFEKPTLIVSKDIHLATEEALNAFLKNLEEPQDNVYFVLTATGIKKVLPTVVSRCQIIHIVNTQGEGTDYQEIEKFLEMPVGDKLNYVEKIKGRDDALELTGNAIEFMHQMLHFDGKLHPGTVKYKLVAENIEAATETYSRLKANGNVNLQLVNFVVNYKNG